MGIFIWIAEALHYPAPGRREALQASLEELPEGRTRTCLEEFLARIGSLSLEEWEELHTRTLDLNPPAPPYIGYVVWGEDYKRGNFLAELNQVMRSESIQLEGELPDHLVPVLRLLDQRSTPVSQMDEVLEPAIRRMRKLLAKADIQNPYISLLDAILYSLPVRSPNVQQEKNL